MHSAIQRGGSHRAETDSAANQFGAPESAEDLRGTFSVVVAGGCRHESCVGSCNRRAIMRTADMLPGESNAQIISSIINLVCPQCGGRMSEFQCEGRCRRNWLTEWEWANLLGMRSSKSRHSRHASRSTR